MAARTFDLILIALVTRSKFDGLEMLLRKLGVTEVASGNEHASIETYLQTLMADGQLSKTVIACRLGVAENEDALTLGAFAEDVVQGILWVLDLFLADDDVAVIDRGQAIIGCHVLIQRKLTLAY